MPDLIATGLAWLHAQQRTHVSRTIVYRRGVQSVSLPATRSRTEFEQQTTYGDALALHAEDFLVAPADLDFGDGPTEPRPGDLIEVDTNGTAQCHEAAPFGTEPCFRLTDAYGGRYRIHTKHLGPVT